MGLRRSRRRSGDGCLIQKYEGYLAIVLNGIAGNISCSVQIAVHRNADWLQVTTEHKVLRYNTTAQSPTEKAH